jgi:hypothetical protein
VKTNRGKKMRNFMDADFMLFFKVDEANITVKHHGKECEVLNC